MDAGNQDAEEIFPLLLGCDLPEVILLECQWFVAVIRFAFFLAGGWFHELKSRSLSVTGSDDRFGMLSLDACYRQTAATHPDQKAVVHIGTMTFVAMTSLHVCEQIGSEMMSGVDCDLHDYLKHFRNGACRGHRRPRCVQSA